MRERAALARSRSDEQIKMSRGEENNSDINHRDHRRRRVVAWRRPHLFPERRLKAARRRSDQHPSNSPQWHKTSNEVNEANEAQSCCTDLKI